MAEISQKKHTCLIVVHAVYIAKPAIFLTQRHTKLIITKRVSGRVLPVIDAVSNNILQVTKACIMSASLVLFESHVSHVMTG